MIAGRGHGAGPAGIALLTWVLAGGAVLAQPPPDKPATTPQSVQEDSLLRDLNIEILGTVKQTAEHDYLFEGPVTITWREQRIQADRMSLTGGRHIEAEGNVLIIWQGNRISGTRMTYDLETGRGVIERAMGQVQGDFIFWAKRAEKVGERTVHLESATVTTCTQPVPYWSFAVTSATVTVNQYARMWNVLVRASRVPFFYSPYLLWPVKQDRALGLLLPEFHTNDNLGHSIAQQLFIPIGRSADLTLDGEYYTEAGFGFGGEFRVIPNRRGAARVNGFFINDKVSRDLQGNLIGERYNVAYQQTQEFRNGFRMTADINTVSDFGYYTDYARELDVISTPTILQRLEFARNGSWGSVNARELRREQLFSNGSTLLQTTLPELEWRGRSRRIGNSPFYLQYEASAAVIEQRELNVGPRQPFQADYLRGDAFPILSLPWSPRPWIDITPRVSYRMTYYTQQQRILVGPLGSTRFAADESLTRQLGGANLLLVGPKFSRIFGASSRRQFKHAIEPRVSYGYEQYFDRSDDIILFDEVDVYNGAGNAMSYALTQRLFAKRPQATDSGVPENSETILLPDGTISEGGRTTAGPAPSGGGGSGGAKAPSESVEIATLEIGQRRSFDESLSRADLDSDGTVESMSPYSDVVITGRYNPDPNTTLDLRGNYEILWNQFSGVTLSGGIRRRLEQLRFSLVYRNGLGGRRLTDPVTGQEIFLENPDDTQVRITAGFSVLRNKLRFLVDGTIDLDPFTDPLTGTTQQRVPSRAWRVEYSTQCCTVYLEQLDRTYVTAERQDFRFRVDLRGIGKILQVTY